MIKPFLIQMQGAVQNPPPGMYKWFINQSSSLF